MTKALEVVSTIKLQKMKKQSEQYRDFLQEFLKVANVLHTKVSIFKQSTNIIDWKVLLLVLSTEKWLCGPINSRLFKHIHGEYKDKKDSVAVFCVWKKAKSFFSRQGYEVVWSAHLPDMCVPNDLSIVHRFLQEAIAWTVFNSIKVCYNYFKNPINQQPVRFDLYPMTKQSITNFVQQVGDIALDDYITEDIEKKDLLLEPTASFLQKEFQQQCIEHLVYWAVLQNKAWEFAARMIAMKNAKDNASSLIDKLTLQFNKARQWAITQEISEIVSAKIALE